MAINTVVSLKLEVNSQKQKMTHDDNLISVLLSLRAATGHKLREAISFGNIDCFVPRNDKKRFLTSDF